MKSHIKQVLIVIIFTVVLLCFATLVNLLVVNQKTSNWLTYQNNEYGFKFKYPSDFYIVGTSLNPDRQYFITLNELEYKNKDAPWHQHKTIEYRFNTTVDELTKFPDEYGAYLSVTSKKIIKEKPRVYKLKGEWYENEGAQILDKNNEVITGYVYVTAHGNNVLIFKDEFSDSTVYMIDSVSFFESNKEVAKIMKLSELENRYHFTVEIPKGYVESGNAEIDGATFIDPSTQGQDKYGRIIYPKEFTIGVVPGEEINIKSKLSGDTFLFDKKIGGCRTISSSGEIVEEQRFKVNGYSYCKNSFGDGSMYSVTYYIFEPNHDYAVRLVSPGDVEQDMAPIDDILKTIKFTN